jgi:hypothetical protein
VTPKLLRNPKQARLLALGAAGLIAVYFLLIKGRAPAAATTATTDTSALPVDPSLLAGSTVPDPTAAGIDPTDLSNLADQISLLTDILSTNTTTPPPTTDAPPPSGDFTPQTGVTWRGGNGKGGWSGFSFTTPSAKPPPVAGTGKKKTPVRVPKLPKKTVAKPKGPTTPFSGAAVYAHAVKKPIGNRIGLLK